MLDLEVSPDFVSTENFLLSSTALDTVPSSDFSELLLQIKEAVEATRMFEVFF